MRWRFLLTVVSLYPFAGSLKEPPSRIDKMEVFICQTMQIRVNGIVWLLPNPSADLHEIRLTALNTYVSLKNVIINLQNNILYIGTSPDYQWLFGQMIQELQLCRPRYDELISLQLRNIFVLISRAIMSAKKFSSTSEKEVAFAMHYFRKNYNTEISIEEYSESRGLSNCWFIQCFKEITGSSPLQYILKLRISNAQSLLENTDYTITEIANMVGYTNSLYFSRLFHKYIGMSPKEYGKVKLKENLRE